MLSALNVTPFERYLESRLHRIDDFRGIEPVVFGTIASANLPSLKTAQRVGRQIAEVGSFVYLDSLTATLGEAGLSERQSYD